MKRRRKRWKQRKTLGNKLASDLKEAAGKGKKEKKRFKIIDYTVKELKEGKEGFSGDTIRKQLKRAA